MEVLIKAIDTLETKQVKVLQVNKNRRAKKTFPAKVLPCSMVYRAIVLCQRPINTSVVQVRFCRACMHKYCLSTS